MPEPTHSASPDPGAAAPRLDTAAPGAAPPRDQATCSYFWDADGHLWRDLTVGDLQTALRQCERGPTGAFAAPAGQLWVDIDSRNPAQHALLRDVFRFHPLAVEDTLSAESRVRVEQYDEPHGSAYLFAIVRAVAFHEETPDPYDLATQNLYFFLGRDYLVTVHAGPAPAVARVRAYVERHPALMGRGVARLAHGGRHVGDELRAHPVLGVPVRLRVHGALAARGRAAAAGHPALAEASVALSLWCARRAHADGDQREGEPAHVGEHVAGVGQQSQTLRHASRPPPRPRDRAT